MTLNELIIKINKLIGANKSHIIIRNVLKVDKKYLIINKDMQINNTLVKKCVDLAMKVQSGYPVQYAVNKAYFMGLEFFVNDDVLIPQPDTEVVVMQVLNEIDTIRKKEKNKKIKILDLCTGSGAIAISIAKIVENVDIVATDKSLKALNVAKKNYKNIVSKNCTSKIYFIQSDMFKNIDKCKYDIIVSNPPYIEKDVIKTLDKEVQCEPVIALDGGKDGLYFYKIIRKNVKSYLKDNGLLVLEIGYNQKEKLQELFPKSKCIKDLANNDRVIIWRM